MDVPMYFALITDRRSGSTMLGATLNQHPQIDCSGEIFNSYAATDGTRQNQFGYATTVEVMWRWRRYPNRPGTTRSVGTLIHRWQAELFPGLWELTRGLHSRFIFVYRDNLLRHFISELIAMNTATWSSNPEFVKTLPKVTVEPKAFRLFCETRQRERANDWLFQPRVEYSLEQMMTNWDKAIERIQRYIGVDPLPLTPALPKQETRTLPEIVANYEEVAKAVKELGHPEWLN